MESFLIPVVVSLVMAFLYAASRKKPIEDEMGNKILRLPVFFYVLGVISIVFGLVLSLLVFSNEEDVFISIPFFMLFFILGMVLIIGRKNTQTVITPEKIIHTSFWGKTKELNWEEISKLSYGKMSQELKIESKKKKIRVHVLMVGFKELLSEIENRTSHSIRDLGIPQ
ncbi:MAG: hypothetical protein ACKOXB_01740 [Flavobacteriales bacterium]